MRALRRAFPARAHRAGRADRHLDVRQPVFAAADRAVAISDDWQGPGAQRRKPSAFAAYRAGDGYFVLAVANNALFGKLAAAIGAPDLPEQPAIFASYGRGAQSPAPDLGADTASVLATVAGWDRARIDSFVALGSTSNETD